MAISGDKVSVTFTADVTQFNAGITTMLGGMKGFTTEFNNIKATASGGLLSGQGNPLANMTAGMTAAEQKAVTLGSRLKSLGGSISQNATSFGVAGASIWGVYNAYDNLVKVEIRAESASNRVKTTQATLTALILRHEEAVKKGNLSSAEMALLEEKITNTKAKLATAQLRESDLQGDVNEAWVGFASQIGPQVVAAGGSIVQIMTTMSGSFKNSGGLINTLKNAFTNLIPSLKSAKAESLLLDDAITIAGTSGSKLKSVATGLVSGISPLGLGFKNVREETKLATSEMKNLENGMISAGSGATGLAGKFGGLAGIIGVAGPLAGAIAAGILAWEAWRIEAEKAAAFNKEFAIAKNLDDVTARVTKMNDAFDKLKVKGPGETSDPFEALLSFTPRASVGNTLIDLQKKQNAEREKANSVTNTVTTAQEKYNAALKTYNDSLKFSHGPNQQIAHDNLIIAKNDLDVAKAVAAKTSGNNNYQRSLTNTLPVLGTTTSGIKLLGTAADAAAASHGKASYSANQFLTIEAQMAAELPFATDSTNSLGDALTAGNQKFQDFITTTDNGIATQGRYRASLEDYVKTNGLANDTTDLSINELETLVAAREGDIESIKALSQTTLGLTGVLGDEISSYLDAQIAAVDYTEALTNANLQNRLNQQGTLAGLKAADQFFQSLVKETAQQTVFNASLAEGAYSLGINSEMLSFSSGKMQELIKTTYAMNQAFTDQQIAAATDTSFIQDNVLKQALLKAGMIQGAQAANDWTVSLIQSTQAEKDEHGQLMQLTADMLGLPVPLSLTNDQLKEAMTNFQKTGDAAGSLANVVTENLVPAFDLVTGLLDAKSFKDFKNNLKDLNLPKGFAKAGKDLDDAMKPMFRAADNADKASKAIKLLTTVPFDDKTFGKKLKTIKDSLEGLTKVPGTSPGIDNILRQAEKMNRTDFIKHAGSLNMIFDAIKQYGFLPDDIASKAIDLFNKENEKVDPSGGNAAKGIAAVANALNNIKTASVGFSTVAKGSVLDFIRNADKNFDSSKSKLAPSTQRGYVPTPGGPPKDLDTTAGQIAAQKLQTALANLAIQGSNSLNILAKNSSSAMTGLKNNLSVGAVAAQKIQTGLANLANQGANSLTGLAKSSSSAMNGLKGNLSVGEVASQKLQTGIANLANQGANSLSGLASASSKNMNGLKNNFKVGEVAAQHLQTALANLANQGANSLSKLASASSKEMNSLKNNIQTGITAVNKLQSAINGLHDKTVNVTVHAQVTGTASAKKAAGLNARGGLYLANSATTATFGEAGAELALFMPLRAFGESRRGDYDITVPSPTVDISGLKSAISDRVARAGSGMASRVGPTIVHLTLPIYLFPGANEMKRVVRQFVLDEVSKYASA